MNVCFGIIVNLFVVVFVESASISSTIEDDGWATQVAYENGTALPSEKIPVTNFSARSEELYDSVDFYLYTRDTLESPSISKVTDETLFNNNIDVSKPVKILIHGYFSGKDKFFAKTIRETYLKSFYYNIINVDWSTEAHSMYWTAKNDVPAVGKIVAHFIDKLCLQTGLKPEQLHVLGHSLGAHIAGVAGVNVQSGKLMRVTGLDPAGPMFSTSSIDRIKPESASFVDVIHTCGKGLGLYEAVGHVDFYPNHGTYKQPGCGYSFGKCSHKRAVLLYAESITVRDGFVGVRCDHYKEFTKGMCDDNTKIVMGEYTPSSARGRVWLSTASSSPYALGPFFKSSAATHTSLFLIQTTLFYWLIILALYRN